MMSTVVAILARTDQATSNLTINGIETSRIVHLEAYVSGSDLLIKNIRYLQVSLECVVMLSATMVIAVADLPKMVRLEPTAFASVVVLNKKK